MIELMQDGPVFSEMGEAGLLCEYTPAPLDLARQKRIWAVADSISDKAGIREVVPGMNNLLVLYDPAVLTPETLSTWLKRLWQVPVPDYSGGRLIEVPVVYGGEAGPDLATLASQAGLTSYDFAVLHAAGYYTVYAMGSQPGFGYLGGMDPRLAAARRDVIHPRVEAGRVIIGGTQTAVQSRTTPSGWHMIGRTSTVFFEPAQTPPALLAPGDKVVFTVQEVLM